MPIKYVFRDNQEPLVTSTNLGWAVGGKESVTPVYVGTLPMAIQHPLSEAVDGQRQEKFTENDFTATIVFSCSWGSRFYWANIIRDSLYPYPMEVDANGRTFLDDYYAPHCLDVSIGTFSETGKAALRHVPLSTLNDPQLAQTHYTLAKLTAQYKALAMPHLKNVDITYTPQIEARTLPHQGFYWQRDRSPIAEDQAPSIFDYSHEISLSFKNVQRIKSEVSNLDGCVLAFPFFDALLGRVYGAGTLLFTVSTLAKSEANSRDADVRFWTVGINLKYNPVGWNCFRRPTALINYGSDMYNDVIVKENGEPWLNYKEVYLETGESFSLFSFITDLDYQNPLIIPATTMP